MARPKRKGPLGEAIEADLKSQGGDLRYSCPIESLWVKDIGKHKKKKK